MTLEEEFNDYWDRIADARLAPLRELLRLTFYAGSIAAVTNHATGTSVETLVAQISAANVGFDPDPLRRILH